MKYLKKLGFTTSIYLGIVFANIVIIALYLYQNASSAEFLLNDAALFILIFISIFILQTSLSIFITKQKSKDLINYFDLLLIAVIASGTFITYMFLKDSDLVAPFLINVILSSLGIILKFELKYNLLLSTLFVLITFVFTQKAAILIQILFNIALYFFTYVNFNNLKLKSPIRPSKKINSIKSEVKNKPDAEKLKVTKAKTDKSGTKSQKKQKTNKKKK